MQAPASDCGDPMTPHTQTASPAGSGSLDPAPAAAGAAPAWAGPTILLVDDDPAVREGLRRVLAGEGWHVIATGSGVEALDRMREREPGLIITDACRVPLKGWITLIRDRVRRPDLPIFVITALSRQAISGAVPFAAEFFQKPLDLDALLAAVRSHLGPETGVERAKPLPAPREVAPQFGSLGSSTA